jgi:CO/xanthine dehydrogenase FAD-binding subunit
MVETSTPTALQSALSRLASEELIPYAGGTDLMVSESEERDFLFVNRIPELKRFTQDEDNYYIGAGLTYTELLENEETPAILKEAVSQIAAVGIRNVGTIGGNIANASPKGDAALICFVTDSFLKLASVRGERIVPIKEFYLGRGKTQRATDELLVEIIMPKRWLAGYGFSKVGARKALAISRVSFAGLLTVEQGVIAHVAIAFGAVEDMVVRKPEIDALLIGKNLEEAQQLKGDYLEAYKQTIKPIQGRVSADYRKQVCLNLLEDFLDTHL